MTSKPASAASAFPSPLAFGVVSDELPARAATERLDRVEERAGRVEMLDHLAGDDEVGGLECRARRPPRVAAVDELRAKPACAAASYAVLVDVEPDQRSRPRREARVQPRAGTGLHLPAARIGEPDVDDDLARPRARRGTRCDRRCRADGSRWTIAIWSISACPIRCQLGASRR